MKLPNHDRAKVASILLTIVLAAAVPGTRACGPFFPNNMLGGGDDALLAAPRADFYTQLQLIPLPRTTFKGHNEDNFADEAAAADTADLRNALKLQSLSPERRQTILHNFERERAKLTEYRHQLNDRKRAPRPDWSNASAPPDDPPAPVMEKPDASNLVGVPAEFADYLQGSMAWYNDPHQARDFWEALLRRPAEERHFRSTWAAFMLGESWKAEDPDKAIGYFQQVRRLNLAGFADRIGLAASSLGEEAQVLMDQGQLEAALNLYLAQLATGDGTAAASVLETARAIVDKDKDDLGALAANPVTRRVINAYILQGYHDEFCDRWLAAMETANVRDVESAEQIALAAYQAGDWDMAQRWVARAPKTPTAQWLHAKLLLRGGQTREAAAILRKIAGDFPAQALTTNKPAGLEDALFMAGHSYTEEDISIRSQIQAETGVLHLARREYVESMDALLRAGFWLDAAYVGERVLTVAELKSYVDHHWPAKKAAAATNDNSFHVGEQIRELLGRRLARAGDFDDARGYYPPALQPTYDAMVNSLDAATNPDAPAPQKTAAFTTAAFIFRTNGMELLGTEVGPDWHVEDGNFTGLCDPVCNRLATNSAICTAGEDELARAAQGVDPNLRFHYRYQAAGLAWEAANLMADNTDEKARMLCTAGGWIKDQDPKAADAFYKALVRHCRKTAIGALADRMHWFPTLDTNGNPLPWCPAPPVETNGPAGQTGYWYLLNRGDTLQDVAEAVQRDHHLNISADALQEANPSINTNRLKAGLILFVPSQ